MSLHIVNFLHQTFVAPFPNSIENKLVNLDANVYFYLCPCLVKDSQCLLSAVVIFLFATRIHSWSSESFKCISVSLMPLKIILALIFLLSVLQKSDGQFEDYCIADDQTPENELLIAMNWACNSGANCSSIEVNQTCFFPNTTKDHASCAFNSYYQNMKHKGGSCYFNATAVLTGLNPSHDLCKFDYIP